MRQNGDCICGAKINWKKDEQGEPHPYNPDGTCHFMSCSFVSERRKRMEKDKWVIKGAQ